jgi:signal transduction histidine kinase/ActR/RegA family two-component response regulator
MESSPARRYNNAFALAAAFLFAVVAVNGVISFREIVSVADKFESIRRYSDTLDEIHATLAALRDAQIGQRGRAALERHLRRLENLTAHEPGQRLQVRRLRADVEAKLQELGGIAGRDNELNADIRHTASALMNAQRLSRNVQRAEAIASSGRAGTMIVLTSLATALLLVLTMVQIGRASRAEHDARKRAEDSYAAEIKARMASEEANRIKDDFIATVSHELRTPLTGILGWTQIVMETDDRELFKEGLETIRDCARAQKRLIDDLLDVSRIMSGKMRLSIQTVQLADVVRAGVDSVRPAANAKGVHLAVDAGESLRIAADPDRLRQIVWNLVCNAVKFTPRGGAIRVRVERIDSQAMIAVSDSGEGIDADFLPHIFEPFRQADASKARVHKGLGLGLSIVKNLVEAHGGTVRVSSGGKGRGAAFHVLLPIAPFTTLHESPSHAGDDELQFELPGRDVLSDVTVLVVDDHKPTLDLLTSVLEHSGATVLAALKGTEAYTLLRKFKPDVFVSDIGMPEEDGLSLISRIRALPKNEGGQTPAIALTAYGRDDDRQRVLRSGFQAYLAKPVEPMTLANTIRDVTGQFHEAYTIAGRR